MESKSTAKFDRDRHIKYWKRCAQLLPEPYTSGEASRMSFGFFIIAALDLLGTLETTITAEERQSWVEWIYACQVPHTGGFRGFTGTNLGAMRSPQNWHWDPANLPNTYFALATLVMLGDDLGRVKRLECLAWIRLLQRDDGSFGEFLGEDDVVQGGRDPRLCMCAVGALKILQGKGDDDSEINENKLHRFIASCQSHDGGIGQAPLLEAHSGLNYCAIATVSFLNLLHPGRRTVRQLAKDIDLDTESCVRWMLHRQTTFIDEDEDEGEEEDEDNANAEHEDQDSSSLNTRSVEKGLPEPEDMIAGFCGRCGKVADTCYCFWNVGALAILDQQYLVDADALRSYLLEMVTHLIGGFGKGPGQLPDLLHSYLGLAVLAIYQEPGLKELDPTFCFSKDAVTRLEQVAWQR